MNFSGEKSPSRRIYRKNVGADNMAQPVLSDIVFNKQAQNIAVGKDDFFVDGVPVKSTVLDGKWYVMKAELDRMGYLFHADLLKLVKKGTILRHSPGKGGCSGCIYLTSPGRNFKQSDLSKYDDFFIPCDILHSFLGIK